ncbi:hypothetical protein K438DRAFT_1792348 [Mycena galopus ATCC 62051]|nr:hypothetical protein K438DRAFT_1792348 [Mycena galopus ATCC 62051]
MPTTPSPSLPVGLCRPSTSAAGLPSQTRNCNGSSRSAQMDKYRAALASLTRQSRRWIRNQLRNANLPKKYVRKTWCRAKFVTGRYTSPAGDGVGEAMGSRMTAPKDARIRNAGVGAGMQWLYYRNKIILKHILHMRKWNPRYPKEKCHISDGWCWDILDSAEITTSQDIPRYPKTGFSLGSNKEGEEFGAKGQRLGRAAKSSKT